MKQDEIKQTGTKNNDRSKKKVKLEEQESNEEKGRKEEGKRIYDHGVIGSHRESNNNNNDETQKIWGK
jgi:hypothetical protein